MTNMLYRVTKYMSVEDVLLAQEEKPKKRERQEDTRQERGGRWLELETDGRTGAPNPPLEGSQLHPTDCPDWSGVDANQR